MVVVGAGVVGASVAYHAARAGASVVVLDRGLPGQGVTADSFAWIGASGVPPGPAAALRGAATREYRRLAAELPDVRVRWSGSLRWSGAGSSAVATGPALDPDQVLVGPEQAAALEPQLRTPPAQALHDAGDGAVDPVAVTEALLDGARDAGAQVLPGRAVTALRIADGRVRGVDTSAGPLTADVVVLAAGVDVPVLCAPTGFSPPVAPSPAVLVRLAAPDGLVRTLLATSDVEVRQAADGTLLAALDSHGEVTRQDVTGAAERARTAITSLLRGAESVRVTGARVGWRPVPADGEPVVGPVPGVRGLYLTVLHSGVSLAAVVGRLAAEEVVHGADAVELRGCRPGRRAPGSV